MTVYSHLIGNERTRNAPFRSIPLEQAFTYDSEDGIILYMSDTFADAQFTAEDGVILSYTPWWPKWQKIREAFENIANNLTEHGLVIGFPCWWHGYVPGAEAIETTGYLTDVEGQLILDVDGLPIEEV